MSAVPVQILPSAPPAVRPVPASLVATTALVIETDADALMEGNACSCAGSDDNPN
ncbi:hypothetical protein ACIPX0_26190 [Streptomyces sp. NPDC090075]|uniref:hypothetical protein n=1 Tax=Streptomyces sp. NPDC090075 TaxID=3365937 RepID=UPI0038133A2E